MNKFEIKKAGKTSRPVKIGIGGASGSGKTYSALLIAQGLHSLESTCVIDTERSAGLYYQMGDYSVIEVIAPYSADQILGAINQVRDAGFKTCIIDSLSHFWSGTGGILDLSEEIAQKRYRDNTFRAWREVTPIWNKIVNAIIHTDINFIVCMRSKSEYSVEVSGGKTIVKKIGLKEDVKDGFEFELDICLSMTQEHIAYISKDRTNLFDNSFVPTSETGAILEDWASKGNSDANRELYELRSKFNSLLELTKDKNPQYVKMNESVLSLNKDRLIAGINYIESL